MKNKSFIYLVIMLCPSLCLPLQSIGKAGASVKESKKSQNSLNPAPGPKKKVPIQSKFNNAACSSYLDRMRTKMDNNWYLPDGTNHVTIKATVGQNGAVDNVELTSSPKNESAEIAANEAFLKAQPLESLPQGSGDKVKLILDFESYADPHGDSRRTISSRIEEIKGEAAQASSESTEKKE